MKIPDHISESLETILWVKKYVNSLLRIRDPFDSVSGMEKNSDPGLTSRIRNTGISSEAQGVKLL
jgi:hypothetical protein